MRADVQNGSSPHWNAIRSAVAHDESIVAIVLVGEVKKQFRNQNAEVTDDELYISLLESADKLNVRNPFRDKEHFILVYKSIEEVQHADWEKVMAQILSTSKMPLLPKALVNVYEDRFAIHPQTVLIAEAEKFVPNLQPMIDKNINSKFVLTTQNTIYARVLESIFGEYDNVDVLLSDIYHYGFTNSRFDLIFACPNFGGRMLSDDLNFMCREFEMVALENLLLHLNDGGRLVITLPARITFASGKISVLRQFVQTTYTIREIGELPEGTISYCGIKVYLLDFENNRPHDDADIIVRRYSSSKKTRRAAVTSLEIADDTFVMLSELEEQEGWSIDRIFAQQDEDYLNYQSSNLRKDMIGNVAEIFRGKAITMKDPSGNISVVNISNIGDYEIDYARLEHLREEERKVFNYLLQEGDVLLPARGTAIRTAVFHEQSYPCIASSNLIVIRPDARILDSTYLKIFLDSPIGNKLISSAQQGTTVMNISYRDLKVLEVPIPPLDIQKAVAKEYLEELRDYRETVAGAERRWTETLARLQTF